MINKTAVLFNYVKIAVRLLVRTPLISIINVGGLSIGFMLFFVLWHYSQNELKTDQFHSHWQDKYRFGLITEWTDDTVHWEKVAVGLNRLGLTQQFEEEYLEIEERTSLVSPLYFGRAWVTEKVGHGSEILLTIEKAGMQKATYAESKVIYADKNAFTFFDIPLVKGDPHNVLAMSNEVVISERIAKKYFGDGEAQGKALLLSDSISLVVTGVFKDLPKNTHLDFDIVMSLDRIKNIVDDAVFGSCYFRLTAGTDHQDLQQRINSQHRDLIKKTAWGDWPFGRAEILFQPLTHVAFDHLRGDVHPLKSKRILTTLSYFSWVILFIAWMNYVNLTISLNTNRAKELVARKSSGARTADFMIQFIIEAIVVHVIAILVAFTFIQLAKTTLQQLLNLYTLDWNRIPNHSILVISILLVLSVLLTSLYPAIITIQRSPKSLFGFLKFGTGENRVPNVLTTFQFSLAVTLIIVVFAAFLQNRFILHRDVGLDVERVVVVDLPASRSREFENKVVGFQDEVSRLQNVMGTTCGFSFAGNNFANSIYLERKLPGLRVERDGGVDENFIPFFGIKVTEGRNFSNNPAANHNTVIISKKTSERLGFPSPKEAVGSRVNTRWGSGLEIIGVIEEYRMRPFLVRADEDDGYEGWPGLALTYRDDIPGEDITRKVCFRIDSAEPQETIKSIENVYTRFFPGNLFTSSFLEDRIENQYQQYTTALKQLLMFASLAIGVACIGLIGMMSNKVAQKTKEIGIRKVMGAAIHQIGYLLVAVTLRQIVLAAAIGMPLSFFISRKYLEEFSERISLSWWHYFMPVFILVVIMFASIASVLWNAAKSNPVKALKYE